jgi:hypothetical protein
MSIKSEFHALNWQRLGNFIDTRLHWVVCLYIAYNNFVHTKYIQGSAILCVFTFCCAIIIIICITYVRGNCLILILAKYFICKICFRGFKNHVELSIIDVFIIYFVFKNFILCQVVLEGIFKHQVFIWNYLGTNGNYISKGNSNLAFNFLKYVENIGFATTKMKKKYCRFFHVLGLFIFIPKNMI